MEMNTQSMPIGDLDDKCQADSASNINIYIKETLRPSSMRQSQSQLPKQPSDWVNEPAFNTVKGSWEMFGIAVKELGIGYFEESKLINIINAYFQIFRLG